jgi:hypothetical protein
MYLIAIASVSQGCEASPIACASGHGGDLVLLAPSESGADYCAVLSVVLLLLCRAVPAGMSRGCWGVGDADGCVCVLWRLWSAAQHGSGTEGEPRTSGLSAEGLQKPCCLMCHCLW